jgi:hypothetical protein
MNPEPEHDSDASALALNADGDAAPGALPAAGNGHGEALDIGSLIRAALLEGSDHLSSGNPDGHAYDGRASLALDAEILPAIDATLDLLTTSTDLFDVPAFDFGHPAGDLGDL